MADSVVSIKRMAETLTTLDARTAQMDQKLNEILNGLHAIVRSPDGRTLLNLVEQILVEVEKL
jgi:hypothetical protein